MAQQRPGLPVRQCDRLDRQLYSWTICHQTNVKIEVLFFAIFFPFRIFAASLKSLFLPFVQLLIKILSIFISIFFIYSF